MFPFVTDSKRRLFFIVLLCGTLSTVVGCGSSHPTTYPVLGKVAFEDGEPVRIGTVEFRLEKQGGTQGERILARGKIGDDGSFQLTTFEPNDGALPGSYQVTVHQLIVAEDQSFAAHGHGRRVSPRYSDYATSGLTAEVKVSAKKDPADNAIQLLLRVDPNDKKKPKAK